MTLVNTTKWVALLILLGTSVQAQAQSQARHTTIPLPYEQLNAASTSFVSNPLGSPSKTAAETVSDGSFEAGTPNPFWTESSTNFGTPLCTTGGCGVGGGTGPRTGAFWAWFGGIGAFEAGSVEQSITIPSGTATLTFWLEIPVFSGNGTDFLDVSIDGTVVFSASEGDAGYATYAQVTVDVSAFADGGVHDLLFYSEITGSQGLTNFFVDDVSLDVIPGADLTVYKGLDFNENTRTGTYHIEVGNNGPSNATGVVATDNLPGAITITGWTETQGTFDPFSGLWTIGDMVNGATVELWIDVTFNSQGRYTNSVTVSGGQDDSDPDNNYDEVSIINLGDRIVPDFVPGSGAGGTISRGDRFLADLLLNKSVDNAAPAVGDDIEYTITVLNQGPQSTAKVEATDVLPACLAFSGSSADRGSYDDGSGIWAIGDLKVGETVTLTITTTVTDACSGEVVNTAEVTASSLPDPDDQFNLFDEEPVEDEIDSASINITARKLTLDGTTFALGTNYPNPFNPTTLIPFSVAEASEVSIKVYDLLGRTVATLVDGTLSAGVHEVQFEASQLPTGMYIVRMEAAGIVKTQRVTLMK